jgi:uncharacterized protein (DUF2267 family)
MGQDFIEGLRDSGGFASRAAAEAAARATLEALVARLLPAEREWLTAALPERLAAGLGTGRGGGPIDVDAIVKEVATREGVTAGTAKEHVEVVLAAVAARLDGEARAHLERALPPGLLAPLPVAAAPPAEPPARAPTESHTLASGRPGSEHPLSESRPQGAQANSVADENPHGDTKLSSSRGQGSDE